MKSVLVVDDEKSVRDSLKMILEYKHYDVHFAEDGAKALAKVEKNGYDVILLDIKMPGIDGLEVLEVLKEKHSEIPVIIISGHGTIETAVEATKRGAFDFLPKPLDRDKVLVTIRNAMEQRNLRARYKMTSQLVEKMREQVEGRQVILGSSTKVREILSAIDRVGPTDARVLITGENGSGKELAAKALHRASRRREMPLVEVNCAAIPSELIESELFGHEKGAFTGASSQRIGKFEQANGGTIFLDEVGDMSNSAQAKVLRALEEGKIERVGGTKQIPVDVRVVAATNKNLIDEIKKGNFREDLYHRLNVIPIHVPSLRERREDIPLLANAFVEEICNRDGIAKKRFTAAALKLLQSMDWSGNVRELRNIVERLVIMTAGGVIEADHIRAQSIPTKGEIDDMLNAASTFQEFKEKAERAFIKNQLELNGWNVSKTAEKLGIQRSHLYNKMKRYGLGRGEREGD
ncbi:MAG TPA: sigma-54 dependent transcriptional regulator [Bacteroidota bacterium]